MYRRIALLTTAIICLVGAALLIIEVGLPGRNVLQPDTTAPDFTLPTLDGEQVTLSRLHDETRIINFWATWCVPCRVEMPALQSIYESYDDVHILAVNLGEPSRAVRRWVDDLGLTFEVLLDADNSTANAYGMRSPPATFVISPEGTIRRVFYGPVTASQLRDVLD